MYMYLYIHVLMRDVEKRKEEASKVKAKVTQYTECRFEYTCICMYIHVHLSLTGQPYISTHVKGVFSSAPRFLACGKYDWPVRLCTCTCTSVILPLYCMISRHLYCTLDPTHSLLLVSDQSVYCLLTENNVYTYPQINRMPINGIEAECAVQWTSRLVNEIAVDPVRG